MKHRLLRLVSAICIVLLLLCITSLWYPLHLDLSWNARETTFSAWLAEGFAGFETTHGSMGLFGPEGERFLGSCEFHHSENGYAGLLEVNTIVFLLVLVPWPLFASSNRPKSSSAPEVKRQARYRWSALGCTIVGIVGFVLGGLARFIGVYEPSLERLNDNIWITLFTLGAIAAMRSNMRHRRWLAGTLIFMIMTRFCVGLRVLDINLVELAALPCALYIGVRAVRRDPAANPAHLCRQCSYNLTGNTSGVCPECGERI